MCVLIYNVFPPGSCRILAHVLLLPVLLIRALQFPPTECHFSEAGFLYVRRWWDSMADGPTNRYWSYLNIWDMSVIFTYLSIHRSTPSPTFREDFLSSPNCKINKSQTFVYSSITRAILFPMENNLWGLGGGVYHLPWSNSCLFVIVYGIFLYTNQGPKWEEKRGWTFTEYLLCAI